MSDMETLPAARLSKATAAVAAAPLEAATGGVGAPALAGTELAPPGEYLSFRLGDEDYGLPILDVQEIRSYEPPTRIAGASPEVLGVVNLRGIIVPVIDLRRVFGCSSADIGPLTVVIVLGLPMRTVGVVVDAVSDVVDVSAAHLRPPPALQRTGSGGGMAITGMACLPAQASSASGAAGGADASVGRMVQLLSAERLAASVGNHG